MKSLRQFRESVATGVIAGSPGPTSVARGSDKQDDLKAAGKKDDKKKPAPSTKKTQVAPAKGGDKIIINPPDSPMAAAGMNSALKMEAVEHEKRAVFTFGRFNPPTIGHQKLVDKVTTLAKKEGAAAHVVASHSQDPDKNPLHQKDKLHYMKKAFSHAQVHGSTPDAPTFMHHAAKLHKAGYTHVTMVAGDDRVKDYQEKLNKYNGHFDKNGNGFHFKSIKVVSAGHRDPDAEGAEGMSASKMRAHAHAGNEAEFKKGLPPALHHHAKEMMDKIRNAKSMKEEVLDEAVRTLPQRIKRAQVMRRMRAKLKLGKRMSRIRMKNAPRIKQTSQKLARQSMRFRVAGQRGTRYQELTPSDKIAVDRIIDKRSAAIKRIAGRLLPRVKQAEVRRLQSIRSGKGAKSFRAFMSGNINAV